MYKKIRKSVADAVANVDDPEQFEWNKWLREPQIFLENFTKPRIEIKKADNFQNFDKPTLYEVKKFALTKFKVSEEIKSFDIKKRKTFKIFFSFPKTVHQKLSLLDSLPKNLLPEVLFSSKDKTPLAKISKGKGEQYAYSLQQNKLQENIDSKIQSLTPKNSEVNKSEDNGNLLRPKYAKIYKVKFLTDKIKARIFTVSFNKLEKIPRVENYPVLNLEKIKEQLHKADKNKPLVLHVEILNKLPKLYKVKFADLSKIKLTLYHLKNLHIKEADSAIIEFTHLGKTIKITKNMISQFETQLQAKILETDKPQQIKDAATISEESPKEIAKINAEKQKRAEKSSTITAKNRSAKKSIFSWEEIEFEYAHLFNYQKEGIKTLLTNKTSLICDELGINKKIQAVHALDIAIKHGLIKNAVIICPESHVGHKPGNTLLKNSEAWADHIASVNPKLRFGIVDNNNTSDLLKTSEQTDIQILSYKNFIKLTNDKLGGQFNKKFECLILDEAQYLINNEIQTDELFDFPAAKFKWIFTSLPIQIIEEMLVPKLLTFISGFEKLDGYLNRTKESLHTELTSIIRNDYWHDLDSDQAQEYENTLLLGRKRISDLMKGGNPFIIQSNIFTLIHQIKQLGNFSTHKETSPKSDLLLEQLETIIASGQKVIIFSQYDKQGIQKIEKLLKNNQIKYVLYQSGMPLKELEKSASSFKNESRIHVMLAGLTAASVKIKIPEASYLIHFDQWWNPINQWQYEDSSLRTDDPNHTLQSVNVINYFGSNSVEINIRETLQKKGLLNKNLIEFISNETIYSLISNEDWLDILDIEHPKSRKNAPPDMSTLLSKWAQASLDEIGQKTKLLFTKLGYKNLMLKPDKIHDTATIHCAAAKGSHDIKTAIFCMPFQDRDPEEIENFIRDSAKHYQRLFVVASEETINQIIPDPYERVTYITKELFVNYLNQFKIN